jgi:type II secretory pathway pseudopilin PulG
LLASSTLNDNKTMQKNNESGFTLIEILIASVIIFMGIIAMGTFLANYIQKNGQNKHRTMATVIAEQKIEQLKNIALGDVTILDTPPSTTVLFTNGDLTAADSDATGRAIDADGNDLGATGAAGEVYNLTWDVNDTNNPHTITTTVTWDGIGNSQVVLMTLINDD